MDRNSNINRLQTNFGDKLMIRMYFKVSADSLMIKLEICLKENSEQASRMDTEGWSLVLALTLNSTLESGKKGKDMDSVLLH